MCRRRPFSNDKIAFDRVPPPFVDMGYPSGQAVHTVEEDNRTIGAAADGYEGATYRLWARCELAHVVSRTVSCIRLG